MSIRYTINLTDQIFKTGAIIYHDKWKIPCSMYPAPSAPQRTLREKIIKMPQLKLSRHSSLIKVNKTPGQDQIPFRIIKIRHIKSKNFCSGAFLTGYSGHGIGFNG